MLQEGVHVQLVRKRRAPSGQFHQHRYHNLGVLHYKKSRSITSQLCSPEPPVELLFQKPSNHAKSRDRVCSHCQYVGKCKPHAMVTLEVSQFMSQHSLQFFSSEQLHKACMNNYEWLFATDC